MKKVKVNLGENSYFIHIGQNEWGFCAEKIKKQLSEDRIFILTNHKIKKIYQKKLSKIFNEHFSVEWISIPDGEKYKTLATCEKIAVKLSEKGATRKSTLLALGGGVVGDVTGFVAAMYMRGIDFIQMPTTLLSQVDSSVGGKTGVDLVTGKNLVGAFHQPKLVLIMSEFLKTLPVREFLCGMAEVVKYGVIWDEKFYQYLLKNHDEIMNGSQSHLEKIIKKSCEIKAEVVSQDEKESGLRAILNYGHTFGHAIEKVTGFSKIKHGEAVAIGMVYAAKLSYQMGVSERDLTGDIIQFLKKYGLPYKWNHFANKEFWQAMTKDKKMSGENIRFILPEKIGRVSIVPIKISEMKKWFV